jgi:hypothetical protein
MYDPVEWAAAQPWSDGNVGMIDIRHERAGRRGSRARPGGSLHVGRRGRPGPRKQRSSRRGTATTHAIAAR